MFEWLRERLPKYHAVIKNDPLPERPDLTRNSYQEPLRPSLQNFTPNKFVVNTLRQNIPVVNKVRDTFKDQGNLAMSVLLAENTSMNPSAKQVGGGPARGLWQFEPNTFKDMGGDNARINDPYYMTDMAKKLLDERGWNQWTAYNKNRHEKFLPYMDYLDQFQDDAAWEQRGGKFTYQ